MRHVVDKDMQTAFVVDQSWEVHLAPCAQLRGTRRCEGDDIQRPKRTKAVTERRRDMSQTARVSTTNKTSHNYW